MSACQGLFPDRIITDGGLRLSRAAAKTEAIQTGPVEKHVEGALLLSCYGPLLTDGQRALMELYYNEDLSLQEIADAQGISRQGVHDILTRSIRKLEGYEERLCLARRSASRMEGLTACQTLAQALPASREKDALTDLITRMIQEEEQPTWLSKA